MWPTDRMRVNIGTAAFPRWRECQREEDYKDLCTWALKKGKSFFDKSVCPTVAMTPSQLPFQNG